jgi:hypothetical protein
LPASCEPGGDQVTPAIKLKRQAIAAKYADVIEPLYAGQARRRTPPELTPAAMPVLKGPGRKTAPPPAAAHTHEPASWYDRNRAEPDLMRAASPSEGMTATAPESAIRRQVRLYGDYVW